jgi:hypothetical protein
LHCLTRVYLDKYLVGLTLRVDFGSSYQLILIRYGSSLIDLTLTSMGGLRYLC